MEKESRVADSDEVGRKLAEQSTVNKKSVVREYFESLVVAIVLALFIRTFIVQAFKIPSGSMMNTLLIGDHILVSKFIYGITIPFTDKRLITFSRPDRGDVIVFKFPKNEKKDFIKRVVGLPGDRIRIVDKQVFVNGKPLDDEKYTIHIDDNLYSRSQESNMKRVMRDQMFPVMVPPDSYFVMGDNRDNSEDSRFWGFVSENKIKGRAFLIYFSWNAKDRSTLPIGWIRFGRIGSIIH